MSQNFELPVAWAPVSRRFPSGPFLAGLSAGPRPKETVNHVRLAAPVVSGRFRRDAGQLLCGAAAGELGCVPPVGNGAVTCAKCVTTAARLRAA